MIEGPRPEDREQSDAARPASGDRERNLRDGDLVAEADEESFPASDPPAWSPTHSGTPVEGQRDDGGDETR